MPPGATAGGGGEMLQPLTADGAASIEEVWQRQQAQAALQQQQQLQQYVASLKQQQHPQQHLQHQYPQHLQHGLVGFDQGLSPLPPPMMAEWYQQFQNGVNQQYMMSAPVVVPAPVIMDMMAQVWNCVKTYSAGRAQDVQIKPYISCFVKAQGASILPTPSKTSRSKGATTCSAARARPEPKG